MDQKAEEIKKLKIGQLAKISGVPVSTIKFYLKEGLIEAPVRSSGRMSYYGREHVDRIALIKKLQQERFLPLNVIKKIVSTGDISDAGAQGGQEEELTAGPAFIDFRISMAELTAQTGYDPDKIRQLDKAGFIHPCQTLQGEMFDALDSRIVGLFKIREDAGIPFSHTIQVMSIYQKHLERAINEDVALCMKNFITRKDDANLIKYITEGDKTATEYLKLAKIKLTRMRIDAVIGKHESIPVHVVEALHFRSLEEAAKRLREKNDSIAGASPLELVFTVYSAVPKAGRKKTPGRQSVDPGRSIRNIVHGILDITEGAYDQALVSFQKVDETNDYFPVACALAALAHICRVSRVAGLTNFIDEMKKAALFIEKSKKGAVNKAAELFASYCRLIGFALRPNFFNIEKDARNEFNFIVKTKKKLLAAAKTHEEIHPFLHELHLKSCYFLVLMHLEYKMFEEAEEMVDFMIEHDEDIFYNVWARKKKADIVLLREKSM